MKKRLIQKFKAHSHTHYFRTFWGKRGFYKFKLLLIIISTQNLNKLNLM